MIEVPAELQAERDALIAEICAAFEGVSRNGGVSWRDAEIMDAWGDQGAGQHKDRDRNWIDLATNEQWDAGPGVGGFAFLDPIGFRYYLPAAMIRALTAGDHAFSCIGLEITLNGGSDRWCRLDARQLKCVCRFLGFMVAVHETQGWNVSAQFWREAYELHWKQFE